VRVFLPLDWLFLDCFANGEIYNPLGELVHIAGARGCLAHVYQYGARDHGLQRRSALFAERPGCRILARSPVSSPISPVRILATRIARVGYGVGGSFLALRSLRQATLKCVTLSIYGSVLDVHNFAIVSYPYIRIALTISERHYSSCRR
jgi:hypothetical protein